MDFNGEITVVGPKRRYIVGTAKAQIQETCATPGWLSGERVGLMTWWLRVRSPVEAAFLSDEIFAPHLCRNM